MVKNIVLIGFMATGKSTVGKMVAEKLKMKFIDSDEEIIKKSGVSIDSIFSEFGENYFRNIESEIIKDISSLEGYVISTGGGVVKRRENIIELKKKGILVFLNASPEKIIKNLNNDIENRPLLNTNNMIEKVSGLLKERQKLYNVAKDIQIDIDCLDVEEVAREVINIYINNKI